MLVGEPATFAPLCRLARQPLAHYEFVNQQTEQATESLGAVPINGCTPELLRSIPGIGELTARTLVAEIETIFRFSDSEKLISYAGLAPRVRQSARVDRRGALTNEVPSGCERP
jgi:transposase